MNKLIMPAVALRGLTVYPDMIIHFDLSRSKSIEAVEQAMMGDQRVFLVPQIDTEVESPGVDQLYHVGTVAIVKQVSKLPVNNIVRVLVEGEYSARLDGLTEEETYLCARITELDMEEQDPGQVEIEAMSRNLEGLLEQYGRFFPKVVKTISVHMGERTLHDVGYMKRFIHMIGANLPITFDVKQRILEETTLQGRYDVLCEILANEVEIARVKQELQQKIKERVDKNQKEYLLREQMRFIQEELGDDDPYSDVDHFTDECRKLKASKEVKEKILKEIARFKSVAGSSSESAVERGYIETLLELPWDKVSKDNTDIDHAEQILDARHYGLHQVKERILEFLSVRALTRQGDSPILCLVGPPGTGKTSIAKSVAEALNKKYVRICLGGVRDEAEIRGHRKTYIGAMPGRIAASLRQAGVKNPLILLDEIDKVGTDQRGDTASALLEVLDSEQNAHFRDHYVEIPLDLSEVLFIATANSVSSIPRPLLDRMEILEVSSYTANEKFHIATEHLVQKQYEKNGLTKEQLVISDSAIRKIIEGYTREAGVRELERKIGQICRKAAREILQQKKTVIRVNAGNLEKFLGKVKYSTDMVNKSDDIGVVRGLAWTSVGGDTLQVEVNMMPGKGEIELTGQLGDVMKESARTGISYIRSVSERWKIPADTFKKNDFHIHIPEGAVPKDGPSAGITMATAILSAITHTPVRCDVAMTGEITLRGRVLPIGGLKEKILAAKTAGVKRVLVPKENEKDVREIEKEITNGLEILYVETMEEVTKACFRPVEKKATDRKQTQ
ncbi:MAG: endopeptidase La [Lachnospiraceae bacterium]